MQSTLAALLLGLLTLAGAAFNSAPGFTAKAAVTDRSSRIAAAPAVTIGL